MSILSLLPNGIRRTRDRSGLRREWSVGSIFVLVQSDSFDGDPSPARQFQHSGVLAKAEVMLGRVHEARIFDVFEIVIELDMVQILVHPAGAEPAFASVGHVVTYDVAQRQQRFLVHDRRQLGVASA